MNNLAAWILIMMFLIPFLVTLIVVGTSFGVGHKGYNPTIKVNCYNELIKMIRSGSSLCIGDVAILKKYKTEIYSYLYRP